MEQTLARRVSAELRAVLGRKRIRNVYLARLLGENEMWVSRRLRDETPITLDELERICAVLDEPLERFTGNGAGS